MPLHKNRADWRGRFNAATGGPIHALAEFVKTIPPPADNASPLNLRWKLIGKTTFNEALDEMVAADSVADLTDAERAYCEGWAAHARQVFDPATHADQDKALLDAIQEAIVQHDVKSG